MWRIPHAVPRLLPSDVPAACQTAQLPATTNTTTTNYISCYANMTSIATHHALIPVALRLLALFPRRGCGCGCGQVVLWRGPQRAEVGVVAHAAQRRWVRGPEGRGLAAPQRTRGRCHRGSARGRAHRVARRVLRGEAELGAQQLVLVLQRGRRKLPY
jgi:hypothetical protein